MTVETHWICDVCGAREIRSSDHENVNETGIKEWFIIGLDVRPVKNPLDSGRKFHKYGYACSLKCIDRVITRMKKAANTIIKEAINGNRA